MQTVLHKPPAPEVSVSYNATVAHVVEAPHDPYN